MNKDKVRYKQESKGWSTAILLGWSALTAGLFLAAWTGNLLEKAGTHQTIVQLVKGSIISILVISVINYVQTRLLRRSWSHIFGCRARKAFLCFLSGMGLAVGLAAIGFAVASRLGWMDIEGWSITPELLGSIAINMMFAFLYEALPEETALRGFAYSTLRLKFSAFAAFLCQLGLFVLVPVAVSYLQILSGMESGNLINAEYIILLAGFGTTLQLLRNFTGSLWTSIGFHMGYLEISRFAVLQREERILTFHENVPGTGELFVLFFMTIIVASVILSGMMLVRRLRARNI